MRVRPNVLTIAGFDPSGGAGILADIKTIEALKCYGLAVCTANTIQTDQQFLACHWIDQDLILKQLRTLIEEFEINVVKIGIVENWKLLSTIVELLKAKNEAIQIIWDPVLSSSTGFQFHEEHSEIELSKVLRRLYLVTPNYNEINQLYDGQELDDTIATIAAQTNLYLKGGHRTDTVGKDELFTIEKKKYVFNPKLRGCSEKHGSGCVLSSAIAAHTALKFPLLKACYRGKRYTEKVLVSNKGLLGYHRV